MGLMSAVMGATVMSVDIPNPFKRSVSDSNYNQIEEDNNFSPVYDKEAELVQYHSHSTEHSQASSDLANVNNQ